MRSVLCKIILISLIYSLDLCAASAADENVRAVVNTVSSGLKGIIPSWLHRMVNPQAEAREKNLEQRVAEADQMAEKAKAELKVFEELSKKYPLGSSNDPVEESKIAEKRIENMERYRSALEGASQARRELYELERIAARVEAESAELDELTGE